MPPRITFCDLPAPECEGAVRRDGRGIARPPPGEPVLSAKDVATTPLAAFPPFAPGGKA